MMIQDGQSAKCSPGLRQIHRRQLQKSWFSLENQAVLHLKPSSHHSLYTGSCQAKKKSGIFADLEFSLSQNYTTDMTTSAPCAGKLPHQPPVPQVPLETAVSQHVSPGKFLENQIIVKSVPRSKGRKDPT